jgi:hypothetical protein
VSPDAVEPLRFNIGVFKKADVQWIAWVGTGRENWAVADAGLLQRRPAVRADSANLLTNADFEAGDKRPAAWNTIWWDTSREPREADREPKCTWPAEGRLGDRCLKIASADAAKMATRQGGFVQDIPSPGPGRCVLGFDLRAAKLAMADAAAGGSFSAYVHVVRKDGSHGANVGQDASTVPGGGFDWTRVEIPIDAPEDAATLAVIFQFQRMTGEVWVDNVTFRRCAGR